MTCKVKFSEAAALDLEKSSFSHCNASVSAEDYEAMRTFYADRLRKTMREIADGAAAAGLTEEKLAELLADES